MAVTQNNYTGNGSTVLFNFTFPYLEQTDVQVRLDGVLQPTTAYSFANATTIQFNTAPGSGVNIIIFRNTDNDNKKATFYPGSAIKAEDLNNNIDQILYVAQEVDNNAMSSLGDTPMQGDLPLGQGLGIIFEGTTTDNNETRLGVVDPTADRNINLPDVSGTVVTTGDTGTVTSTMIADGTIVSGDIADGTIVNADVNASAAIAGTKINPAFGTQNLSLTGNISVSGTVDGRDLSTDGSKLDGIESGATADQTAAEIRTLVESATDSNVFTDADHTKLNNIETAATADQTASEIKSLYESNNDTNPLTDAEKTFLSDVTATATEINYTTNVTSDIQSQIDGKQPLDSELTTLAGMQSQTASQLASSTALSATTTNLNITQGMTKATTLTTNSDTEFPTSKAVNDRILTVTNALGGFVAIADKDSFPTSHPDPSGNAGTVVSISNAQGISVNSSGVGTLATRAGGSDAVIINGFPSALRGGATVGSSTNANPYVLPANVGLQVQTTGTAHTYDYHKYLINEEDANKLSGEIQDFQERYRVAASAPTSSLNDGDLYFDTTVNKMKVYNASGSSWDDVATPGDFLINTISSSSGSGGGSATFNGTATRFQLSNPPDQYAQQLLVSINGVIQKPNSGTSPSEGFAIDGNDIIFASAPPSGASYFIITQGSSVNIGTPSDNTVSTSKIQNLAVTTEKIANDAITNAKIADNAIENNQLADGEITHNKLASNSVTAAKIADDAVGAEHIEQLDADLSFADSAKAKFGAGNDLQIYHDGSTGNSYIKEVTANVPLRILSSDIQIRSADDSELMGRFLTNGAAALYYDGSKKLETWSGGVIVTGNLNLNDNDKLALGDSGSDLQIFHDGSNSYIKESGVGNVIHEVTDANIEFKKGGSEHLAKFISDGAVELYYDNSAKFQTTGNGVQIMNGGVKPFIITAGEAEVVLNSNGSGSAKEWRVMGSTGGNTHKFRIYDGVRATDALNISSVGDVGIGVGGSVAESFGGGHKTLEVAGTTNTEGGVFKTATSGSAGSGTSGTEMIMFTDSNKAAIAVTSNHPLEISSNGSLAMKIEQNGTIGIGNSSPQSSDWGTTSETRQLLIDASKYAVLSLQGPGATGATHRVDQGVGDNVFYMAYNNTDNQHNLRLTLDNGNLLVERGHVVLQAAGAGIDFHHGTGSIGNADNILDDYEEGTWTPEIQGTNGTTPTSYYHQDGAYTKIGRLVTLVLRVRINDATGLSGDLRLDNLPFNVQSVLSSTSLAGFGHPSYFTSANSSLTTLVITPVAGGDTANFYGQASASTGFGSLSTTYISSGFDMRAMITYYSA